MLKCGQVGSADVEWRGTRETINHWPCAVSTGLAIISLVHLCGPSLGRHLFGGAFWSIYLVHPLGHHLFGPSSLWWRTLVPWIVTADLKSLPA